MFRLLRLVFCVFQTVYWQLNGTAKQLREAHLPENYDRSAEVLDVLLSYEFCSTGLKGMENFICTHNRFEGPQYVLDNDHINLMFITDTHAVFCEPISKGKLMLLWFWNFYQVINYFFGLNALTWLIGSPLEHLIPKILRFYQILWRERNTDGSGNLTSKCIMLKTVADGFTGMGLLNYHRCQRRIYLL